MATVASGALISILLARHFGAEQLGLWSVGMVYANLVGTVVEGGLGRLLMRDASREPEAAGRALGLVLKGRLYLGLLAAPAALLFALGQVDSGLAWVMVLLLVLSRWIEGIQSSYQGVLYTMGDFRTPNLLETWRRLARVAAVGLIVLLELPLWWAAAAMLLTAVLSNRVLVRATRAHIQVDYSGSLGESWRDAAWFWLNGVLFWINSELSLLVTAELAGQEVTGYYAAAVRLTALFLILPRALNNSLIPRLFKSAKTGEGLHAQLSGSALLLVGAGGVIWAETHFFAGPVTELVYGAAYRPSIPVLEISALFLWLNFARIPCTWYLSTSDRVRMVTVALGLGALANVAASLLLVPSLGAQGAAWAGVVSEGLLGLWALAVTARYTGPRILLASVLGVLPGLLAYTLLAALHRHLPWFVAAAASGAAALGLMAVAARRLQRGWNPLGLLGERRGAARIAGDPGGSV